MNRLNYLIKILTKNNIFRNSDYTSKLTHKLAVLQQLYKQKTKPSILVVQQKNNCVYTTDTNKQLKFLSEIQTEEGVRGVVLDIRDKLVGSALYEQKNLKSIIPTNVSSKHFSFKKLKLNQIIDINGQPIVNISNQNKQIEIKENLQNCNAYTKKNVQKTQIPILNPILNLCHKLLFGDFIAFQGQYGSGQSDLSVQVAKSYILGKPESIILYLSFNVNRCIKFSNSINHKNWVCFSEKTKSDAGGLFLAYKLVNLAKNLRNQGYDVLVIIQNFEQIFRRQISLLKNFNQPIAPFSVINQLYYQTDQISKQQHSITSIITIDQKKQGRADLDYQINNHFTNSIAHIKSLTKLIKIPLNLEVNNNNRFLSECINKLIREKKQFELKKQLKLDNQPWDHYFLHDSQWWVKGLKTFQAKSAQNLELFLKFIEWNIQNQYCSQWNSEAVKIFQQFEKWRQNNKIVISRNNQNQEFEQFILYSKMEGFFSPFKNDYIS